MTTYVSYTDNGKDRCKRLPDPTYSIGERFDVGEVWDLFIDNNLESRYVEYVKISDIDKEFVVNEEKTYITYEVSHYGKDERLITQDFVRESDIEETLNL
jgi:hypothetical protein